MFISAKEKTEIQESISALKKRVATLEMLVGFLEKYPDGLKSLETALHQQDRRRKYAKQYNEKAKATRSKGKHESETAVN